MLVFLLGSHAWGVAEPRAAQMAEFLTFPIFTFAGAAFAMDAVFKMQGKG